MHTFVEIVAGHLVNGRKEELKRMERECDEVIEFIHLKLERMLDRGVTPVKERSDLGQAQENMRFIRAAIAESGGYEKDGE